MGATPSPTKIPMWIDCDSGHDDAFAILIAAHHPHIDLMGVSTVHGNSSLANTTYNTLSILDAIGQSHIPVFPGASKPFCRDPVNAEEFHGSSGLDGTTLLPTPTRSVFGQEPAVHEIAKALYATSKDTAWLVAIGPLTNIALLFAIYPDLVDHIKGLSIMGGAIGSSGQDKVGITKNDCMPCHGTGATSYAEFNIWCDPESARSVFRNAALRPKTVLIPLDLTNQACATPEIRQRLVSGQRGVTKLRQAFYELIMFYGGSYARDTDLKQGPPLHDALAVAAVMFNHDNNGIGIQAKETADTSWSIDVILSGKQLGRTVVYPLEMKGTSIPSSIEFAKFWEMLEDCLDNADKATGYQAIR